MMMVYRNTFIFINQVLLLTWSKLTASYAPSYLLIGESMWEAEEEDLTLGHEQGSESVKPDMEAETTEVHKR